MSCIYRYSRYWWQQGIISSNDSRNLWNSYDSVRVNILETGALGLTSQPMEAGLRLRLVRLFTKQLIKQLLKCVDAQQKNGKLILKLLLENGCETSRTECGRFSPISINKSPPKWIKPGD